MAMRIFEYGTRTQKYMVIHDHYIFLKTPVLSTEWEFICLSMIEKANTGFALYSDLR